MNNNVVPWNGNPAQTMSSREIADLVESRHDNVKRTIETLASRGVIAFPQSEEKATDGRPAIEYRLGKRDSLVVVAQLSPEFTGRVIDRWQQLETAAPALPNFADPIAAARAWADAREAEQKALVLVEQQKPAVEFVGRYVESNGAKGFREVAKLLRANEREFREFLVDRGILYRLGGALTPAAPHMDAGRFVVKAGASDSGHAFNQAKFTPKGVTWIAGEWGKYMAERNQGGEAA